MKRFAFLVLTLALGGCATGLHDVQVDGALEVTGATTLTGATTQTGALTVTGAVAADGGITVDTTAFTVADTTGNVATTGTLAVTGNSTLTGDVDIGGAMVVDGVYETFGEGADKGIFVGQIDGTAVDGTAGAINLVHVGDGNVFGYIAIGGGQAVDINMAATGLDISGDQDADNEGREFFGGGWAGTSGRPFVVGTDAAFYFTVGLAVTDVSGTDTFVCGLRLLETHQAAYDGYNTYYGIGFVTTANPAAVEIIEELNGGAGASTDTTKTLADTINLIATINVSAAGVTTIYHDAAAAGTPVLETASGVAFTFDDGDMLIPYCHYLEHTAGGYSDAVIITHWEAGLQ